MATDLPLDPPFGAFGLPGWAESARRMGESLPRNRLGMHGASLLRGLALMGRAEPFDIEALPGVMARIYPSSNRCEKRVMCAPQLWDFEEREILTAAASSPREAAFTFFDLGSNVGLYALTAAASAEAAGQDARVIAVEPDIENRRRLSVNIIASGLAQIDVAPVAIGARKGWAKMHPANGNRGEVNASVREDGDVEMLSILDLATRFGVSRIDAMKVDLEGMDGAALAAFLPHANDALKPDLLFVETTGLGEAGQAAVSDAGYAPLKITRHNTIYKRETSNGAAS